MVINHFTSILNNLFFVSFTNFFNFFFPLVGWLVVRLCQLSQEGPGTIGEIPTEGVFLRYPSQHLREFRRKS